MAKRVSGLVGLGAFAVSMAYLEAAVVVYLRRLYYPEGFSFPMKLADPFVAAIEVGREIATIVMLGAVGFLSGETHMRRSLSFLFAFGLWDIFYYLWLKVLLGWPQSWLDWDVLFLIPVPWFGPWVAPALIALVLSVVSGTLLLLAGQGQQTMIRSPEIILAAVGALACLVSFTFDGFRLLPGGADAIRGFVPTRFIWEAYLPGIALIATGGALAVWRNAGTRT
ncbi:MAG: hypothetical protein ACPL68_07625 [Candidatus Hydrothermia bacterium]